MKVSFYDRTPMLCELQTNLTEEEKLKAESNSIRAEISYLTKKMNTHEFANLKKVSIYSAECSRIFLFYLILYFF